MRDLAQIAQFQALQTVVVHEDQLERIASQRRGFGQEHQTRFTTERAPHPLELTFMHENFRSAWLEGRGTTWSARMGFVLDRLSHP